jgi:hypothetical protein
MVLIEALILRCGGQGLLGRRWVWLFWSDRVGGVRA